MKCQKYVAFWGAEYDVFFFYVLEGIEQCEGCEQVLKRVEEDE